MNNVIFRIRKIEYVLVLVMITFSFFSCTRTQNCECKTYSIAYYPDGSAYDQIETTSFAVKGSKNENKTQCEIIQSNQLQSNGYTTECSVLK